MKKKIEIIPAILEKKFSGIEKKYNRLGSILKKSFKEQERIFFIQVDICDGKLTPKKTFLSNGRKDSFLKLKKVSGNFLLELDLIINFKKREIFLENFLMQIKKNNIKRIIFHNKGVKNWEKIFEFLKNKTANQKTEIGLGIWLDEKNSDIVKILEKYNFDYIQIMGIEKVGFGGQKISPKVFKKAKYFSEKFPNLPIQVDGGVKLENSKKLFENGVSKFVSGSGIFSEKNLGEIILSFKKEIKK